MAQIKNNQVRGLINPSFNTRTTTPQMRGTVDMTAARAAGGFPGATPFNQSMIPGGQSKVPAPVQPANYKSTAIQSLTSNLPKPTTQPNISTSAPQTGQTTGPAINSAQNSVSSGTQGALNTTQTNGVNSRGGIDKAQNPNQNSFKGILGSLLGASKATSEQERTRKEMERIAAGNKAIGEQARGISDQYSKEIARVGGLGAGAVAGNLSTGTNVVGSGNAAIASQSASARMDALAKAQQAALEGTAQQLTGQEQAATAFKPSLEASLTQQQLGLSGLGTAAGLAAPSVAPYGQTSFNPLQPGFAEGNMEPQTQATNVAQQLMSGRLTYEQALEAMSYAGESGKNFLNQALSGMGANPLQLQAQGMAQQSNIQTGGTAQTNIAYSGLDQSTKDYMKMNTFAQVAHQQASAVSDILNKTGLNNVNSADYNKAINSLSSRFSSADMAAFKTALTEAQLAYSNLLQAGGGFTPTGQEQAAITTLDSSQSAPAINASIQQLENAVARKLQALETQRNIYQNNLNTGQIGGYTGGGSTGGGTGWDDILD